MSWCFLVFNILELNIKASLTHCLKLHILIMSALDFCLKISIRLSCISNQRNVLKSIWWAFYIQSFHRQFKRFKLRFYNELMTFFLIWMLINIKDVILIVIICRLYYACWPILPTISHSLNIFFLNDCFSLLSKSSNFSNLFLPIFFYYFKKSILLNIEIVKITGKADLSRCIRACEAEIYFWLEHYFLLKITAF